MNKDAIIEILSSKSENLSVNEIQSILDNELNKSEEEMDVELIERCLDALESIPTQKANRKRARINFTKVLIAAVIFVLLFALTIPVCAKYFNINVPNGIVEFYGDHFDVDISNNKYVDDILAELEKNGIKDAVLPKIVFEKDTKIYDLTSLNDGSRKTVVFSFNNEKSKGKISIQQNNNQYSFDNYISKLESSTEQIKTIKINEIQTIIYTNNDCSYIEYNYQGFDYTIAIIESDYETACQIAQTI